MDKRPRARTGDAVGGTARRARNEPEGEPRRRGRWPEARVARLPVER